MGMAKPFLGTDVELDAVVDEAIAAADGDVRKAILGLIRGQHELAAEVGKTVSAGYVRRELRRWSENESPPSS